MRARRSVSGVTTDVPRGPGCAKRGIGILEIGKLEGRLETRLRDPKTRQATLDAIGSTGH